MLIRNFGFLMVTNLLWLLVKSDIAVVHHDVEHQLDNTMVDYPDEVHQKSLDSLLTSSRLRKTLQKLLQQMPTGWPEHNIPPLAPYTKENITVNYENDYFRFYAHLERLQISNLNKMEITKLKNKLIHRRIDFDFTFPNISVIGKFDANGSLDLLSILGISSNLTTYCDFKFDFDNLRLNGSFRYKVPVLLGSVSIHDLETSLELDGMNSQLNGAINSKPITPQLNNLIATQVFAQFNQAKSHINLLVARILETQINRLLVGKKIWDLL